MRTRPWIAATFAAVCVIQTLPAHAERTSDTATARVEERNVRAQMQFLAGDAMQGRGSGTTFERIAAEYVGSQFMQFGLEPAGDTDVQGHTGYVQRAPVKGELLMDSFTFEDKLAGKLDAGKNMRVISIASETIAGPLQKMTLDSKQPPKSGAVVLVDVPADAEVRAIFGKLMNLASSGVAAIIFRAPSAMQSNPQWLAKRKVPKGASANVIAVDTEAAGYLAKLPEGTPVKAHARFTQMPDTATWNAVAKRTGSDPTLKSQVILLTAHLDHLGVLTGSDAEDTIYNGADDDASGTVAVLELARALGASPTPKRTVYFVAFGSEEAGALGSQYFSEKLPFAKKDLVANLEFEMIGRPDTKVAADALWLTGYDRSTLGPDLAKRGAKLVDDPRPEEHFFERSDNYVFARQGIIAHTVSSFGLHGDYHRVSDDNSKIDFAHMTRSIQSLLAPVNWLVNSDYRPTWHPGKSPEKTGSR